MLFQSCTTETTESSDSWSDILVVVGILACIAVIYFAREYLNEKDTAQARAAKKADEEAKGSDDDKHAVTTTTEKTTKTDADGKTTKEVHEVKVVEEGEKKKEEEHPPTSENPHSTEEEHGHGHDDDQITAKEWAWIVIIGFSILMICQHFSGTQTAVAEQDTVKLIGDTVMLQYGDTGTFRLFPTAPPTRTKYGQYAYQIRQNGKYSSWHAHSDSEMIHIYADMDSIRFTPTGSTPMQVCGWKTQ